MFQKVSRMEKKFEDNRWGVSGYSVEIVFVSEVPKKIVGEPFSVSLISGIEKVWRRGGYQDFTSKIFSLTVPKISVGESFTVALISGAEKVWIRGGSIKIFRRKIFVPQSRKST